MNCNRLFCLTRYIKNIARLTCNNTKIINEILYVLFLHQVFGIWCVLYVHVSSRALQPRGLVPTIPHRAILEKGGELAHGAGSLLVAKTGREFQMLEPICGTPWGGMAGYRARNMKGSQSRQKPLDSEKQPWPELFLSLSHPSCEHRYPLPDTGLNVTLSEPTHARLGRGGSLWSRNSITIDGSSPANGGRGRAPQQLTDPWDYHNLPTRQCYQMEWGALVISPIVPSVLSRWPCLTEWSRTPTLSITRTPTISI